MYDNYNVTYIDLTVTFEEFLLINKNSKFRFLIHNGDVDTVCNYLGDAWFMKRLADRNDMKVGVEVVLIRRSGDFRLIA